MNNTQQINILVRSVNLELIPGLRYQKGLGKNAPISVFVCNEISSLEQASKDFKVHF